MVTELKGHMLQSPTQKHLGPSDDYYLNAGEGVRRVAENTLRQLIAEGLTISEIVRVGRLLTEPTYWRLHLVSDP